MIFYTKCDRLTKIRLIVTVSSLCCVISDVHYKSTVTELPSNKRVKSPTFAHASCHHGTTVQKINRPDSYRIIIEALHIFLSFRRSIVCD